MRLTTVLRTFRAIFTLFEFNLILRYLQIVLLTKKMHDGWTDTASYEVASSHLKTK